MDLMTPTNTRFVFLAEVFKRLNHQAPVDPDGCL
jgi:hypothetical protein